MQSLYNFDEFICESISKEYEAFLKKVIFVKISSDVNRNTYNKSFSKLIEEKRILLGIPTYKTEFQKYIIRNFNDNVRVIVIDNVLELDAVRNESNIDLT